MLDIGKERFILTKSYEVAYAIFRLVGQMEEKDFGAQLKASGTALLAATAGERYAEASGALQVMECLVKFGTDVNIIGTANSDVTLREIYALDAAIAERKNAVKTDRVNVAEIFSKPEIAAHAQEAEPATGNSVQAPKIFESEVMGEEAEVSTDAEVPNINGILKSAIRQTAILERIRQSGNCRLKDIQEILPECSERTIRYDLQTLLEQDLIERIGNAGPSVFYRARQAA
jgi:hypothetical protein